MPSNFRGSTLMMIKRISYYLKGFYIRHLTSYIIHDNAFCCIFFVPLFFLRSTWSRSPTGYKQGSIPTSRLYFALVGGAVALYLSGLGSYPLPFPPWPFEFTDYLIFDWTLPIAHQLLWFFYCLLPIVYYLLHQVLQKALNHHQHAYRW